MALVFATPYFPSAPPRDWVGLQMTWTGWDGSVWNLTSAAEGAVMLPGVRGLNMPPVVHYSTAYASVPGARWRGHTVDAREVFWPIQIYHDVNSQGWIDRDRAFWKTLRPEKTGTWTVKQPSGAERKLDCRFSDDGDFTMNQDPALSGWSNYGITLVAEQPFWRATPITREWNAGGALPFYPDGSGGGFTISPSTTLDTAAMPNPGDVEAYPVWEVHGPTTSAQVGIAGRNITIPFSVDEGKVLRIDTNPAQQSAYLYDVAPDGTYSNAIDMTPQLGEANFVPVPADSVTTTTLSLDGAGKVSLILTPLYLRAW